MKISLNQLSLYTDTASLLKKYTIKELQHLYSIHTAEIEAVQIYDIPGVVIGKILSAERHPESTKLWICSVSLGEK